MTCYVMLEFTAKKGTVGRFAEATEGGLSTRFFDVSNV